MFTTLETNFKTKAIDAARERLNNASYDLYHTFEHHQAVFEGCKRIIEADSIPVDIDAVEIACFWHDVFKGQGDKESELLRSALTEVGLSDNLIEKVIQIIAEHSFGKEQTLIESKVLYDADKIELVSIERWKKVFEAFQRGEVEIDHRDRYIKEWNRRMPLLENHLFFPTSNKIFSENLRKFKEWLRSINKLDDNGDFISEISQIFF